MLIGQFIEEGILELLQRGIYMSRNGNGLTLIFRGVDLDQVLEFVIIDIVWQKIRLAPRIFGITASQEVSQTHMAPIVAQIALETFLRTSFPRLPHLQTFLQWTIAETRPFYVHVTALRGTLHSPSGQQRCFADNVRWERDVRNRRRFC
jgi:hypothetical protein